MGYSMELKSLFLFFLENSFDFPYYPFNLHIIPPFPSVSSSPLFNYLIKNSVLFYAFPPAGYKYYICIRLK